MKQITKIFISLIIILTLVNSLTWLMSLQCRAKAQKQELIYDYSLLQGCMIKKGSKWIDYDKYITLKE